MLLFSKPHYFPPTPTVPNLAKSLTYLPLYDLFYYYYFITIIFIINNIVIITNKRLCSGSADKMCMDSKPSNGV